MKKQIKLINPFQLNDWIMVDVDELKNIKHILIDNKGNFVENVEDAVCASRHPHHVKTF